MDFPTLSFHSKYMSLKAVNEGSVIVAVPVSLPAAINERGSHSHGKEKVGDVTHGGRTSPPE